MKTLTTALLLLLTSVAGWAQYIDIRVSVHIILNPTTGLRPGNIADSVFQNAASNANLWMGDFSRGYRYRISEIVEIGGPLEGSIFGPSQWYGKDFRADPDWSSFQDLTKNDSRYRLRSSRINVYVATGVAGPGNSGGGTPIPPGDLNTAVQIFADDGAWWLAHELGHFFGLRHTFSGEDQSDCTPGDDGIADTFGDSRCWTTLNQIALYHYLLPYSLLSSGQKSRVDDVLFNTMSYHNAVNKNTLESHKTEGQLDREADIANTDRSHFVSGKTVFASPAGLDFFSGTASSSPKRTPGGAAAIAGSGDIVLFRAGSYPGSVTIAKAMTLRATRIGAALLGK